MNDNKNYELLNICTREATNQYEQPQLKTLERKPSVENQDCNEKNNVKNIRTKIRNLLYVGTIDRQRCVLLVHRCVLLVHICRALISGLTT